jgi:hypothetical protein
MMTLSLSRWRQAHSVLWRRYADVSLAAWLFVGFASMALIGLMWDGAWHQSWGRDTFFIPPHDLMYTAVTGLFVVSALILLSTQKLEAEPRPAGMPGFHTPAGVWVIFAGCLTLFTAAPIDEWYHRTFGVDNGTGLWSPPHFLGMVGGLAGCLGVLLLLRSERQPLPRVAGRPRGLRHLSANDVLTLIMFAYITLIVGGLSMNFWAIRYWYRVEGTLYPWLALLYGPMVLVIAQRVTRRAGAATLAFLIPFFIMGTMGLILTLLQYPLVVSLPVMAVPSALLLDWFYARYGSGYRWLLVAGPICTVVFYIAEYFWAWYLTGHPWHDLTGVLWIIPVAILASTANMLLGAWIVDQLERVDYFRDRLAGR